MGGGPFVRVPSARCHIVPSLPSPRKEETRRAGRVNARMGSPAAQPPIRALTRPARRNHALAYFGDATQPFHVGSIRSLLIFVFSSAWSIVFIGTFSSGL